MGSVAALSATTAAKAAPARFRLFSAPALISTQGSQTVTHWVYSSLKLDRDTLNRVPPDADNAIENFDWNVEEFNKVELDIDVQLENLPHDESWFAKIDSSLIAGIPPDVVQGSVSEAAKYIPLGALSPIDPYLTEAARISLSRFIRPDDVDLLLEVLHDLSRAS